MITLADLEDVIDAVKAIFEAQFPEKLQEIDSQKSNPLNPDAPKSTYFGFIKNIPQMPAMLFGGNQTAEEEDEGGWRRQRYSLEIEAYYQGQDVQQLNRIIRRYGQAIDQVLRANQTLGGLSQEIKSISQRYWDPISAKLGLLQVVNVSFEVILFTN